MSNISPFAVKDAGGIATKVEIIIDAYSQLRISGITVQPTPEDLEVALMRLENMMAEWQTRVCVGYNFEDNPDPNTEINVKRAFWHCLATNLAVRLIPDFNKAVPQVLMLQAGSSYSAMSGSIALDRLNQVPYPTRMPRGSGNTLRYNRWSRFYRLSDTNTNTCAVEQMFIGDVNDFTEHFDAYLADGETIASYSITSDSGLDIVSSSNTDNDVMYRIQASNPSSESSGNVRQLTIIATTSEGRIDTRYTIFQLVSRDNN